MSGGGNPYHDDQGKFATGGGSGGGGKGKNAAAKAALKKARAKNTDGTDKAPGRGGNLKKTDAQGNIRPGYTDKAKAQYALAQYRGGKISYAEIAKQDPAYYAQQKGEYAKDLAKTKTKALKLLSGVRNKERSSYAKVLRKLAKNRSYDEPR